MGGNASIIKVYLKINFLIIIIEPLGTGTFVSFLFLFLASASSCFQFFFFFFAPTHEWSTQSELCKMEWTENTRRPTSSLWEWESVHKNDNDDEDDGDDDIENIQMHMAIWWMEWAPAHLGPFEGKYCFRTKNGTNVRQDAGGSFIKHANRNAHRDNRTYFWKSNSPIRSVARMHHLLATDLIWFDFIHFVFFVFFFSFFQRQDGSAYRHRQCRQWHFSRMPMNVA